MKIDNSDLYSNYDKVTELKLNTYKKLLAKCENTIKYSAKLGELMCIFTIPNFLVGADYPIINILPCAQYIIHNITEANAHIKAEFIEPNLIFIDWRRTDD